MTSKEYMEIGSKIALDAFSEDEGNGTTIIYEDYDITKDQFVDKIMPQLISLGVFNEEYDASEEECSVSTSWFYLQYVDEDNIEIWAENEEDVEYQGLYYEKLSDYRDEFLDNFNPPYELKGNVLVYPNGAEVIVPGPNTLEFGNYINLSNQASTFALVDTLFDYYEDIEKVLQELDRLELREGFVVDYLEPYPSGTQVELKDGKNLPKYDVYPLPNHTFLKVELDGFGEIPSDSDLIEWEVLTEKPKRTKNPYYPKSAQDLADNLPLTLDQDANFETLQANIEDISLDQLPKFDKCKTLDKFKDELTKFYVYEILSDFEYGCCDMLAQNDGYGWEIVSDLVNGSRIEEAKIVEKLYQEQDWLEPSAMEELFNNREDLIDYLQNKEEDYDM